MNTKPKPKPLLDNELETLRRILDSDAPGILSAATLWAWLKRAVATIECDELMETP